MELVVCDLFRKQNEIKYILDENSHDYTSLNDQFLLTSYSKQAWDKHLSGKTLSPRWEMKVLAVFFKHKGKWRWKFTIPGGFLFLWHPSKSWSILFLWCPEKSWPLWLSGSYRIGSRILHILEETKKLCIYERDNHYHSRYSYMSHSQNKKSIGFNASWQWIKIISKNGLGPVAISLVLGLE